MCYPLAHVPNIRTALHPRALARWCQLLEPDAAAAVNVGAAKTLAPAPATAPAPVLAAAAIIDDPAAA